MSLSFYSVLKNSSPRTFDLDCNNIFLWGVLKFRFTFVAGKRLKRFGTTTGKKRCSGIVSKHVRKSMYKCISIFS